MNHFQDADSEFARMLNGDPRPDLARIALEIARDFETQLDIEKYLKWIDGISRRVRERCQFGSHPLKILNQINWAMFVEEGFHGNADHYYDPRNSYLNQVIERKTGIPITLCILYRAIAERLGLELEGVNLPAHFMLKFEDIRGPRFIDPFHGDILDRSACERRISALIQGDVHLGTEHLDACPPVSVVLRMLRNLKAIHLQEGDRKALMPLQKRLALILADDPKEIRDLGLLYHQIGRMDEAVVVFDNYLDRWPQESDATLVESCRRDARREIILRN